MFIGGSILDIKSLGNFLEELTELQNSIEANITIDGRGLIQRSFYRGQSSDFESSNNVASVFRQKKGPDILANIHSLMSTCEGTQMILTI